tara:strand:- start:48 stop:389 length:342 start_codon:yes stop_codon:yes gene_type:complete
MSTKVISELSKKNFINIFAGHIPTFPLNHNILTLPFSKFTFFSNLINPPPESQHNKIIIEKVEYYKGLHIINNHKIHNIEFDKRELDKHVEMIGSDNIKFENDGNKIIMEYLS